MKPLNNFVEGFFDADSVLDDFAESITWKKWLETTYSKEPEFKVYTGPGGVTLDVIMKKKGSLTLDLQDSAPLPQKLHKLNLQHGVHYRSISIFGEVSKKDIEIIEFDEFGRGVPYVRGSHYGKTKISGTTFLLHSGAQFVDLNLSNVTIDIQGDVPYGILFRNCTPKNLKILGGNVDRIFIELKATDTTYNKIWKGNQTIESKELLKLLKQDGYDIRIKNLRQIVVEISGYDYRFNI